VMCMGGMPTSVEFAAQGGSEARSFVALSIHCSYDSVLVFYDQSNLGVTVALRSYTQGAV
jgi:hypothetical protein